MPPQQHLTKYSPSPSTTSYTVSSLSSPRRKLVTIIRHLIRLVFAYYAILALLMKFYPQYQHHHQHQNQFQTQLHLDLHSSPQSQTGAESEAVSGITTSNGRIYGDGTTGKVLSIPIPNTKLQNENDIQPEFWDEYITLAIRYSPLSVVISSIIEGMTIWVLGFSSMLTLFFCLRRDYTEESILVLQGMGIQTSTSSPYYFMNPTTTFIPTTQIQDIVIHEAFKGFEVRFYLAVIVEGATELVVVFPHLLPRRVMLEEVWRGTRKCLYGNTG